ncbi:GNAT family N-acetyltransferase [Propionicimonas sp.]|uniref:GNAT family N-acetyltransferase n=1 Tax=Propionicimonas sp. TaxID=1955623 RepID=UPI0039E524E7
MLKELQVDGEVRTARLVLRSPSSSDAPGLFDVFGDPAVWRHYPGLRHRSLDQTSEMIASWQRGWELDGLGVWIVRLAGSERIIGSGGCSVWRGSVWNLGYRIAADQQGRGFATELSRAAVEHAARRDPSMPVVAYMVEHNRASTRVAEKLGFTLVQRVLDPGNPDPQVHRLVYADRTLDDIHREQTAR